MGREAHEIIGTPVACLYPAEAVEGGWPALELNVAGVEGRFETENRRVRRDSSRFWAHVVLRSLCDDRGELRGFGKLIRELSRGPEMQRVGNVGRSMEQLIAMLSHELRNPLAAILFRTMSVAQMDIDFKLDVNGELRQSSNTSYMTVSIERLVEIASRYYTLYPGDVLLTGTCSGVGPVKPGDIITTEFAGLGRMAVRVA